MKPKHDVTRTYQNAAIYIDHAKCIACNLCVKACDAQAVHVYAANERKFFPPHVQNDDLLKSDCIMCGQCAAVCPVGAIVPTDETNALKNAIEQKRQIIALIAPSTRFAIGEPFGQQPSKNNSANLVRLLKEKYSFFAVYDVNFGADETTIVDTEELIEGMRQHKTVFTSCCPGWINLMERKYPDLIPQVSTAKSCVEMVGALVRRYFKNSFIVEIMPCTAKKGEKLRDKVIDCCITVVELAKMFKDSGVTKKDFDEPCDAKFDEPFGFCSGGAYMFGKTGGVGESVLRQLSLIRTGQTQYELVKDEVQNGIKIKTVKIGGGEIRMAICSGGEQIDRMAQMVRDGIARVDIVEQMACSNGCQGGGGMPKAGIKQVLQRGEGMKACDDIEEVKAAGQNMQLTSIAMDQHEIHRMYHTQFQAKK